ncbi:MAG: hypothetical protein AAFU41_00510 [Pseudomonadota bacterium]
MTGFKTPALTAIACLLAACGGGGGGGGGNAGFSYAALFDASSAATSDLITASVNPSTGAQDSDEEELNRGADTITLAGLPGSFDPATRTVTFDGGGTATLTNGPTTFVAQFTAEPVGVDPFNGVVGVPTAVGDLPTTGQVYAATDARVVIIDSQSGPNIYDLTATLSVDVDFAGGNADMMFTNLDGTKNNSDAVDDVAVFSILGATLTDNQITGGTAEFTGTIGEIDTSLTTNEIVMTNAALYGPGADEVGGVFTIDDRAGTGNLFIVGSFTAD